MLTAACHVLLAGIKVAAADDASRLGAWPMKVDGRGGLRTSGCGRQRLTPSTDEPVMGRSADYSCFVSSVPERRLLAPGPRTLPSLFHLYFTSRSGPDYRLGVSLSQVDELAARVRVPQGGLGQIVGRHTTTLRREPSSVYWQRRRPTPVGTLPTGQLPARLDRFPAQCCRVGRPSRRVVDGRAHEAVMRCRLTEPGSDAGAPR
jgi:hypothetical protein